MLPCHSSIVFAVTGLLAHGVAGIEPAFDFDPITYCTCACEFCQGWRLQEVGSKRGFQFSRSIRCNW